MGFREGQAEQILIASFRQFPLRKAGPPPKEEAGGEKEAAESVLSPSSASATTDKAVVDDKSAVTDGGVASEDTKKTQDVSAPDTKATKTSVDPGKETTPQYKTKAQSAIRYTDEGKQVPVGNGGSTTRYVWTQTLEEATVHVPVPEGTRAKDLDVEITPTTLSIRKKSAAASDEEGDFAPLSGTFFARVRPSECTWTMESDSSSPEQTTTILIALDKIQKTWWSTILSGDPEIDNTMVDSTRHIGTYDEKTQAQIRRIMFDQRQERLGLPGSGVKDKAAGLPEGVELIDGETLEKADGLKNGG